MSDYSLNQSGPIATYYNEVYKGNPALLGLGFFDVDHLEVLSGPQGTLYGKNTTGGAVNLIMRAPTFDTNGYATVGYGNYNAFTGSAAFNTAITKTLAVRVAVTGDVAGLGNVALGQRIGADRGDRGGNVLRALLALLRNDNDFRPRCGVGGGGRRCLRHGGRRRTKAERKAISHQRRTRDV